jgi:hypothetical protein
LSRKTNTCGINQLSTLGEWVCEIAECHGTWLVEKWKRMLDFGVTLKSVLKDTCRG